MKLSVLIPSLESRSELLKLLLTELYQQILTEGLQCQVQVIFNVDNKQITTGAKRNLLLNQALSEYIVFIDDDDIIYENYIRDIYKAILTGVDCVGTTGHYTIDNGNKQTWMLSKDYTDHDNNGILYRRANHLTPVKRELALLAMFPDKSNAEDKEYSQRLNQHLKTETIIEQPIYHYKYQSYNKEYV